MLAKARQGMTDRRLGKVQGSGCPGQAALPVYGIEHVKKVKIEPV